MQKSFEKDILHILSSSPAIVYSCRASGDFGATFVSGNIEERLGYTVEECLKNPNFWRERIHPDDYSRVFGNYDLLFSKGYHIHEYRFRHNDGTYLWIHDELRLIRDGDGNPLEFVGSWLDISANKKAEQSLHKSEVLFRHFFQTNPVATIITAPSGTVHMINPAFTEVTGYSGEDILGKTAQDLGFWRDLRDRERMINAIEKDGHMDQLETQFYEKNNRLRTCLISSRGVEFKGEQAILNVVIDITEKKKADKALRRLEQTKSEFVASAAHELRTPLSTITGFAEILASDDIKAILTEEQKSEILVDIQSNCARLDKTIDALLDISRIEAGQEIPLDKKPQSIKILLETVINRHHLQAQQSISLMVGKDVPTELFFDAHRIEQVVENLISNAIKYSPDDSQISVTVEALDQHCQVRVSDNGIGMTLEQKDRVFERFYRVNSTDSGVPGVGLGLSIVKKIVEDHGGKIWIDSTLGRGTNVRFILPQ